MLKFSTVPIGEVHARTVTGKRTVLLQEYAGFIQGVPSGQAAVLKPGGGKTPRRSGAGSTPRRKRWE